MQAPRQASRMRVGLWRVRGWVFGGWPGRAGIRPLVFGGFARTATVFRGKALGGLGGVAMRVCSLSAFRSAFPLTNSNTRTIKVWAPYCTYCTYCTYSTYCTFFYFPPRTEHVPTLSENMSIQNQDMSTEKRPNSGRFDRLESHQSQFQLNSSRFTLQTLNFRFDSAGRAQSRIGGRRPSRSQVGMFDCIVACGPAVPAVGPHATMQSPSMQPKQ